MNDVDGRGCRPAAERARHVFTDALADTITIDGADGHHLQRVRRLVPGEVVTAADGSGAWRVYEVVAAVAGGLQLAARGTVAHELRAADSRRARDRTDEGRHRRGRRERDGARCRTRDSRRSRAIGCALGRRPRPRRTRTGCARSRARPRCSRGAPRVPVVEDLVDLADLAGRPDLVVADRGGAPAAALAAPASGEWTVLVGPEGGFTAAERSVLAAVPVLSVGAQVLRAVTAPVAAVSVLVERIAQIAPS